MELHQPTILTVLSLLALVNAVLLAWAAALGAPRTPALLFALGALLLALPGWAVTRGLDSSLHLALFNIPPMFSQACWLAGLWLITETRPRWTLLTVVTLGFALLVGLLLDGEADRDWRVFTACSGYALLRAWSALTLYRARQRINRHVALWLAALILVEALAFALRAVSALNGQVASIQLEPSGSQVPIWLLLLLTGAFSTPLLLLLLVTRVLEAYERNSERLRATLQALPDMVFEVDREGRYVAFHTSRPELLVTPPERFLGRLPEEVLPPPIIEAQRAAMAEVLQHGRAEGFRYSLATADGERWFEVAAAAKYRRSGNALDGFVFIVRDVTERRRAERIKEDFVAVISHELRTPLTSIIGAVDLLQGGALERPRQRQMLDMASRNAQRLAALIDDLLDFERLSSGRLRFEWRSADIGDLVRQALAGMRGYAEPRGVQLRLAPEPATACVRVDTTRFAQVMDNLLSNAVKASSPGMAVEIAIELREGQVEVSVRDHGPGVPAEFIPQLFQPFSQADARLDRRSEGTGLGLAIVHGLLRQMGGEISHEPAAGGGALFRFSLPLSRESAASG